MFSSSCSLLKLQFDATPFSGHTHMTSHGSGRARLETLFSGGSTASIIDWISSCRNIGVNEAGTPLELSDENSRNWALWWEIQYWKCIKHGPYTLIFFAYLSTRFTLKSKYCGCRCQHDRDRYHAGRTTFKILVWDDLGNWSERKQKDELARMNLLSVYLSIYHVSCFSVYVSNTQLLMNCALLSLHPYFTLTNLWSSNMAMENPPSTNVFRLYTFQRLDFP